MSAWKGYDIKRGPFVEQFKTYLRDRNIEFEPSENGSYIHFEVRFPDEYVDAWIDNVNKYGKDTTQYVYQFPDGTTVSDVNNAKKFGLKYLGEGRFKSGIVDQFIQGTLAQLKQFAEEYLGYELHPDYICPADEFAGIDELEESGYFDDVEDYDLEDKAVKLQGSKFKDDHYSNVKETYNIRGWTFYIYPERTSRKYWLYRPISSQQDGTGGQIYYYGEGLPKEKSLGWEGNGPIPNDVFNKVLRLCYDNEHKNLKDGVYEDFQAEQERNLAKWGKKEADIWRRTDWKARNYEPLLVPSNSFVKDVKVSGYNKILKDVKFVLEISPNSIFEPRYVPEEQYGKYRDYAWTYDGTKKNGYIVLDRADTWENHASMFYDSDNLEYSKYRAKLINAKTKKELRDLKDKIQKLYDLDKFTDNEFKRLNRTFDNMIVTLYDKKFKEKGWRK